MILIPEARSSLLVSTQGVTGTGRLGASKAYRSEEGTSHTAAKAHAKARRQEDG